MNYRLEHVAIRCKDLEESIEFYRKLFGGTPTEVRTGAGYRFCFVKINGEFAIQLMESKEETGAHHYGFIAEDVERVAKEFKEKGAKILRENRDPSDKLTGLFLEDPNGLQVEVRIPR
ncbi:MAG: VOC family protein [Deltaproteobacteria bacterium]|nr:VOC family protein [Deltaproteobacteria bacterium]